MDEEADAWCAISNSPRRRHHHHQHCSYLEELTQPWVRYWATLGEIGGLLLQDNNSLATIFTEFDRDRSGRLSYKGNAQHHQRHVLYSDS
jgi:homospermidine synthase